LRTGDYLVGPEGTVFIASIEPPKPMLVVMTNENVSLMRPGAPLVAGLNPHSAVLPATETVLLAGFPASLLIGGVDDRTKAGLADDTKVPGFTALLPIAREVQPRIADLLVTDDGQRFVVNAVERLGAVWRFSLTQAVA
jgi:hypothetical protein